MDPMRYIQGKINDSVSTAGPLIHSLGDSAVLMSAVLDCPSLVLNTFGKKQLALRQIVVRINGLAVYHYCCRKTKRVLDNSINF